MSRIPPQNLEAEQCVLGSCLLDYDAFLDIRDSIKANHFYKQSHSIIWKHITKLANDGQPLDIVSLNDSLIKTHELDAIGGTNYLIGLADNVPTAAYVNNYARMVVEASQYRELIVLASTHLQKAYDSLDTPLSLISSLQNELSSLETQGQTKGFYSSEDLAASFMENLDFLKESPKRKYLATGFIGIDNLLTGFESGKLYLLAARPAMGKSALALAMASNAAVNKTVAFFCLEMEASEIFARIVTSESKVSSDRLKNPNLLHGNDYERITNTLGNLSNKKLYINDDVTLSIEQMKAAARKLKNKQGLDLIVIDYAQLLRSDGNNRQEEISNISRSLKLLARELETPVLALSQLSRAVESRLNKRPMLSDLRDSGSLEQDADVVMFIYRDDYYNQQSEKPGIAEVIVAKHRNGPTGTAELAFIDKHVRFEDLPRAS